MLWQRRTLDDVIIQIQTGVLEQLNVFGQVGFSWREGEWNENAIQEPRKEWNENAIQKLRMR